MKTQRRMAEFGLFFLLTATLAAAPPSPDKPMVGALTEWPLYGGNLARNGQTTGGLPLLSFQKWRQPQTRAASETPNWIMKAEQMLKDRGQPCIPAATPITTIVLQADKQWPLIVYRSHWGVHAVEANTGKVRWESPSSWSLDRMARDTKKVSSITQWINTYMTEGQPNVLVENSTVGTLSTDGNFVFMVEDFEIPPARKNSFSPFDDRSDSRAISYGLAASKLQAYELASGKLKWEIGGLTEKNEKDERKDCYFLGPPLPLDGLLYVAVEKAHASISDALLHVAPALAAVDELRDTREVRLAVLDPRTGKLESIKTLFTHRQSIFDSPRRSQAVHLAYGSGVLVCCAHTGTIVGVDLLRNRLLWSFAYRDKYDGISPNPLPENPRRNRKDNPEGVKPGPGWELGPDGYWHSGSFRMKMNPPAHTQPVEEPDDRWHNPNLSTPWKVRPNLNTQWKTSPPVIAEGKVIFAATDAPALNCLDLRSGERLWSVPRLADDLYLAGATPGKAWIVGKSYVRTVTLAKGEQAWRTPTGTPSGFGTFSANRYYLPLQSAISTKQPEICVLEADKGAIAAHVRSPHNDVPGNLVFFREQLLSQTATELAAYPLVESMLKNVDQVLTKNPNDPEALYQRAALRESKGDLVAAVEDLRAAAKNKPPEALRGPIESKLFETLTELLQRDFDKGQKYLHEYEALGNLDVASVPFDEAKKRLLEEQKRRRLTIRFVVCRGYEQKGKLVEAARYYLDLAATDTNEVVALPSDPALKVRLDIWARGRLEDLLKKATPEQRRQIEEEMVKRWEKKDR